MCERLGALGMVNLPASTAVNCAEGFDGTYQFVSKLAIHGDADGAVLLMSIQSGCGLGAGER